MSSPFSPSASSMADSHQESKRKKKKRQRNLLREPSLEEEQQALQSSQFGAAENRDKASNVIQYSTSPAIEGLARSEQQARRQCRRSGLAALLVILFSVTLLLASCPTREAQTPPTTPMRALFKSNAPGTAGLPPKTTPASVAGQGSTTSTSTVAPITLKMVPLAAETPEPPTNSAEIEEPITSPSLSDSTEEPNGASDDAESGEPDSSGDGVEPGGNKSDFLMRTAGEAVDEMVVRMRGAREDAPVEPEEGKPATSDSLGAAANGTDDAAEQLRYAMETYGRWRATADDVIDLFSRKLLPIIIEHGYEIDAPTMTGLLQVFNGIRTLKPWALKLLDASAKLSPGILLATQSDFGDFDECLNVRVDNPSGLAGEFPPEKDPDTGLASSTVIGRYCLADVEFPKPPRERLAQRNEQLQTDFAPIELRRPLLNFSQTADFKDTIFVETGNFFHMLYVDPLRVGICLTNKIEPDSFAQVLNKLLADLRVSIHFRGRCVTKYDQPVWTIYQKVSVYVLVSVCSLVALCTLLDIVHTKLNKLPLPDVLTAWKQRLRVSMFNHRPLFTSFSIVRNTKRLFKPQPGQQNDSSSSSESSPSTERRASVTGSALNLISEHSSLSSKGCTDKHQPLNRFQPHQSSGLQAQESQDTNLRCLHGIRVITMTWMIVNHTYLFGGFFVLWAHRRLIDIAEWPKSVSFQLVLNGWLTVETYFFLSAAIIVLNVMPLIKARKFTYFSYILHRLVRLMPAYVGLVCLNFLWPLISSGPVWLVKGRSFIQTPCENYLWTNFLFINNWIWPEKQCMVHTWFLSADFQLYLVAPIIVYLLCRRPVFGHSLNLLVAIIASIFSGFVIYANKLMPTTLINKLEFDSIKQQLSYSYFATYQHMGPYCLGIFIGYLLHKRPEVRLPKHVTWALWLLMPPLSFTTLLLTYLWNGAYDEPNLINPSPLISAFYVAIHRTIWTSLLAWIVFACATGRAKLMCNFLSHPLFVPLSRLSFSIYLVHLPIIMFRALNLRHTIEWTDSNILWEACGNFIASIVVGYFVNVTFESPFINLEAVICGRPGQSREQRGEARRAEKDAAIGRDKFAQLQPTNNSKVSSQNINDSDDSKSAETLSEQPDSPSLEQERRLSEPGSLVESTGVSPRQARWSEYRGSLRVKALRPKQSSVEQIFGSQVEPVAAEQPGAKSRLALIGSPEPPSVLLQQHLQQMALTNNSSSNTLRPLERFRRYSSYESPAETNHHRMSSTDHRWQQHARGISHAEARNNTRPSQYATLARTSRFNHEPPLTFDNRAFDFGEARLQTSKTGYQLADPSTLPTLYLAPSQQVAPAHASLNRKHQHLLQRRQGRYNTLTGAGTLRDWRHEEEEEEDDQESRTTAQQWQLQRPKGLRLGNESSSVATGWQTLQPGAMIPRVDSSTLRRHLAARVEPPSASIREEESSIEEREEAAL